MTGKRSAGIVLYRHHEGELQVLLGHMGGPYWSGKDAGAWSIPKGMPEDDEEPETTARREFTEELGLPLPPGELRPLGEVRQAGGKLVQAWALAGDLDPEQVIPGTYTMEWPRGSGRFRDFPELDRVAWFSLVQAKEKIVKAQAGLLDRLEQSVAFGQH